jgi:hypothetical protein
MAALECDLQSVLADQAHVVDAELLRRKFPDPGEPARGSGFAPTLGAWTSPSELLARIAAAMAAFPRNLHHLAFAIDVDVEWKRVGVLQLLCRPFTGR